MSSQLWHLFKYTGLTEIIRQKYKISTDLPNKFRVGNIDDDEEKLLKARFMYESDENYPKDTMRMYAENEPAMKRNKAVLNDLPGEVRGYDQFPDN